MKTRQQKIKHRMKSFKQACRDAGIKVTLQRMEIFREVALSLDHPDADTVHRSLHRRMPSISLDTVYRTLWLLKDLGLIRTLGAPRGRARFDANLTLHHHFVCTQCGATYDFYSEELNKLCVSEHVKRLGRVETTQIQVQGTCLDCSDDNPVRKEQTIETKKAIV